MIRPRTGPEIPEWLVASLQTGEMQRSSPLECWLFSVKCCKGTPPEWDALRDEVVADYIEQFPGRRPWAWWLFDAPPPELVEVGEDLEPVPVMRRKVGGSGSLTGDPRHGFGLATYLDTFDPPRPDALPRFESEAAYLKRLGLLSKAEARRLRKRDFEPEAIDVDPEELAECWEFLENHGHEFGKTPPAA